jgi:hypothetical protein
MLAPIYWRVDQLEAVAKSSGPEKVDKAEVCIREEERRMNICGN